jgi:glycosyltransferase involved in cell wall biosynthesis
MHSKPLFSIIIPIYNYGRSLERCVDSVLNQDGDDYQIILINDGSTDNTDEICKTLCTDNPGKITHLTQKNSGPSAARNKGLQHASGQFVTFLDADDEMTEHALPSIRDYLKANKVDAKQGSLLIGGHTSINEKGVASSHSVSTIYDEPSKNFTAYLIDKNLSISNGAIYFHQTIFNHLQFPEDIRSSEDIPVFALALANHACFPVSAPLVKVYKHSDSLRNQAQHTINTGLGIVPCIFDSPLLPESLKHYRKQFESQRLLSLFRSLYNSGHYKQARDFYRQAIAQRPTALFKLSYLRKFIKSFL